MILLGEVSFSLYLTHQIANTFYLTTFPRSSTYPDILGATISTCGALAAAFTLHHFIEGPARRALRKMVRAEASLKIAGAPPRVVARDGVPPVRLLCGFPPPAAKESALN
jgi:peptidoglycan/LPS O-acetylase OafA/YrhL